MARPIVVALLAVAGVGLAHASADGSRSRSTGFVAPNLPALSRQTLAGSVSRGGEAATSSLRMLSQEESEKQPGIMGMLKSAASGVKTLGVAALLSLNFVTAPPADAVSPAKSDNSNYAEEGFFSKLAVADENDFSVEIKIKGLPKAEEVPGKIGNFLSGLAKVRVHPLFHNHLLLTPSPPHPAEHLCLPWCMIIAH